MGVTYKGRRRTNDLWTHVPSACFNPCMAVLDEKQVVDLLLGDTDPRQLMLFVAQMAMTMDAQERMQRETILRALEAHATQQMVKETHALVSETNALVHETIRVVFWTRLAALAASAASIAAVLALIATR